MSYNAFNTQNITRVDYVTKSSPCKKKNINELDTGMVFLQLSMNPQNVVFGVFLKKHLKMPLKSLCSEIHRQMTLMTNNAFTVTNYVKIHYVTMSSPYQQKNMNELRYGLMFS